ncbi:MAG: C39 family peptidase [Thiotrichales bacterium]
MLLPIYFFVGFAVALLPSIVLSASNERSPVKSLLETRHEEVVVQQWDLSCGAAALATILKYEFNESITERDVASGLIARAEYLENPELVRHRQGFSLLDMKRYVESIGYEGIGLGSMSFEDLIDRAPIIVPINASGYNHFIVFKGMRDDKVWIADPAWGNRFESPQRFMKSWIEYPRMGRVAFQIVRPTTNEP